MPYRILCFDGGGICGLFTARVLERIVANVPDLVSKADLLAGTSTGGIIALSLAAGKSPAQVGDLYRDRGDEIFDDSFLDNLLDVGKAVGADYGNKRLKKILTGEYGTTRLTDLSTRVLIPTFDLDAPEEGSRPRMWKPKLFHNFPGSDSDGGESLVDVALRTSAAPTYFPSYQGYIDGGVFANDPSMCALAQALDSKTGKQKLDDVVVLSLSTGLEPRYLKGETLDWGWGQWARPLTQIMIGGVMGVTAYQCSRILGDRYHRVDLVFDRPVELDDVRDKSLTYLENAAASPEMTKIIAEAVAWLGANW